MLTTRWRNFAGTRRNLTNKLTEFCRNFKIPDVFSEFGGVVQGWPQRNLAIEQLRAVAGSDVASRRFAVRIAPGLQTTDC